MAIKADNIPQLDMLDPAGRFVEPNDIGKTRRHYFLRRSIGTLFEFSESIGWIDDCPEMKTLKISWGTDEAAWDEAAAFFRQKAPYIKTIRNDIGGHFGMEAAHFAVSNLDESMTGTMERYWDSDGQASMHLNFAGEIAANAFLRHLTGTTVANKVESLFKEVLMPGYRHAAGAVQMIAYSHLWNRFGS